MDTPVAANQDILVSIVMPAYNASAYIEETIRSVLAQTYMHWELIVVDDGSTDATAALVSAYCQQDARIRYVYQENARQSSARNHGINLALGEYVAFLDADDLWLPYKLAVQVPLLQASTAALIYSEAYAFENYFELGQPYRLLGATSGMHEGKAGLTVFLQHNRIPTLTVLVKRKALLQVGNFIESALIPNAEDYHLWLKLLLAGYGLLGIPNVLGAYREHANSVSSADRLGLHYVIEAKGNLLANYPEQRFLLLPSIRQSILHHLATVSQRSATEFYQTINRYLQLGEYNRIGVMFKCLKVLGMQSLSLRLIYFVFNYL